MGFRVRGLLGPGFAVALLILAASLPAKLAAAESAAPNSPTALSAAEESTLGRRAGDAALPDRPAAEASAPDGPAHEEASPTGETLAAKAASLPEQIVAGGPQQVIIRRTSEGTQALLVTRPGGRRAILTDQSLTARPMAPIGGRPALLVRGWSGGAYCCFTLHVMRRTRNGWDVIGSFAVGKQEETVPVREGRLLWIAENELDFWDMDVARATDLRVPVAYSLQNGRLMPDVAAMRRPQEEALGDACPARGGVTRGVPGFASLAAAAAGLAAGEWGQDPRTRRSWRPEAEHARRALCLLYAGHGDAAMQLLDSWPDERRGHDATRRQITARLACTGLRPVLRALNRPDHPWLVGDCGALQGDLTALHTR